MVVQKMLLKTAVAHGHVDVIAALSHRLSHQFPFLFAEQRIQPVIGPAHSVQQAHRYFVIQGATACAIGIPPGDMQ